MSVDQLTKSIREVRYRPDVVSKIEPTLRERIQQSNASMQTWEDPPGTSHAPHDHPYAHRVFCVRGWIEFTVSSDSYRLGEGDALDLPEGVTHSARTSPSESTKYWLIRPPS